MTTDWLTLDNRHTGEQLHLRRVVRGGAICLELKGSLPPRQDGPPLHIHFKEHEEGTVIAGTLSAEVDGRRIEVPAGGTAPLPMGSAHRWWNAGDDTLLFEGVTKPVIDLDVYLGAAFEVLNSGPHNRPPLFYIAHLAWGTGRRKRCSSRRAGFSACSSRPSSSSARSSAATGERTGRGAPFGARRPHSPPPPRPRDRHAPDTQNRRPRARCGLASCWPLSPVPFTIGVRPIVGPRARALTDRRFAATPARLERGRYLAVGERLPDLSCRTGLAGPRLSGQGGHAGRRTHVGSRRPGVRDHPNITPDRETGAGRWNATTCSHGQSGKASATTDARSSR